MSSVMAVLPVSARQVSPQPCALCRSGGLRVHATTRRMHIRRRVAVLRTPPRAASVCSACGGETCRPWHLGCSSRLDRSRPRSRSPRRRSRRLRGVSRRDASSAGYGLLASRRAPPRMRRTAPPRVAQLGARPLAALPHPPIGAFFRSVLRGSAFGYAA